MIAEEPKVLKRVVYYQEILCGILRDQPVKDGKPVTGMTMNCPCCFASNITAGKRRKQLKTNTMIVRFDLRSMMMQITCAQCGATLGSVPVASLNPSIALSE